MISCEQVKPGAKAATIAGVGAGVAAEKGNGARHQAREKGGH